jgi:hypothetical protein
MHTHLSFTSTAFVLFTYKCIWIQNPVPAAWEKSVLVLLLKSNRHLPPPRPSQLPVDLPVPLADCFIVMITAVPTGAYIRVGECRFERDTCDWYNDTTQEKSSASWRLATVSRRPANLPDKTFGAPGKNSDKKM